MYETGQGKTALTTALAATKALAGDNAIVLNQSEDLTFRDYKKSLILMNHLPITVMHLEESGELPADAGCIAYASVQAFFNWGISKASLSPQKTTIILDEFDSFVFDDAEGQEARIKGLLQFPRIFGLSGSDFQIQHTKILEDIFMAQVINLHLTSRINSHVFCKSIITSDKKSSYFSTLLEMAIAQTLLTPVVLIMDSWSEQLCKQINGQNIRAENLSAKDAHQIEALIGTFQVRNNGRYGVFIINQDQGRGLDFHSNSEIEQNGGVYLIIGCLPQNFLSFNQQVGRTGRIGNKGQYSIVICNKECRNMDGEAFFKLKLEELKNKDIQNISKLSQSLHKDHHVSLISTIEEEKEALRPKLDELVHHGQQPNNDALTLLQQPSDLNCQETISESFIEASLPSSGVGRDLASQSAVLDGRLDLKKRKIKEIQKIEKVQSRIGSSRDRSRVERDAAYFQSYAMPEIHREMTEDKIRMNAYDQAITQISKNRFVVDVGAGSGILCIMAARAGASKVIGVEFSDYYRVAEESIRDNGLEHTVQIVHSMAEDFILVDDKADIIVSEWMGYFLIFENMLPSVLAVKEQALKQDGVMIPRRARIMLAAFHRPEEINGIVLKSLEKVPSTNASIELVSEQCIVTEAAVILDLDLQSIANWRNIFSSPFELIATKQSSAKGLVGWFETELVDGVTLSTSPFSPPTHWKQTLFYFQQEISLNEGENLVGNICVAPNDDDHRGLQIQIDVKKAGAKKPYKYNYCLQ